jgi:hypothetical protein
LSAGDFLVTELGWVAAVFLRVALSVGVVRLVYGLLESGAASKKAFERSKDLGIFGWRNGGGNPRASYVPPGGGDTFRRSGFDDPAQGRGAAAEPTRESVYRYASAPAHDGGNARFIGMIGEYKVFHHDKVIRPDHHWPCPIVNHHESCRECFLFVVNNGVGYCAAVEKLKELLAGHDDGKDIHEVRQDLRSMREGQA